jgi:hypothetical protein
MCAPVDAISGPILSYLYLSRSYATKIQMSSTYILPDVEDIGFTKFSFDPQ